MERLDDAHRRPPGPEQFAGGGRTEGDRHVAKLDCTATGIGVHNDFGGNGVGEAQIVRGSHAVDKHPRLVAAPDGGDDGAGIGRIWLLGEFVEPGLIVKAATIRLRASAFVRRCSVLSTASRDARSTKSLGVQTLRGSAPRMRSSMTVFRPGESLFMSEICSTFSDGATVMSETDIQISDRCSGTYLDPPA